MAHYARATQTTRTVPHPNEIFLTSEPIAVSTVPVNIEAIINVLQKNNIIVHLFPNLPLLSEKEMNKAGAYHSNNLNNDEASWSLGQALEQLPEHGLFNLFLSPVGNKKVEEEVTEIVRFIKEGVAGNVAAKTELNIDVVGCNEQLATRECTTSDCVLLNYQLANKIQQLFQLFAIFMDGLNINCRTCSSTPSKKVVADDSSSHHHHSTTQKPNTCDSNACELDLSTLSAAPKSTTTENTQNLSTKTWTKDITGNKDKVRNKKLRTNSKQRGHTL